MKAERNSSIELLRIIAMSFIVIWHLFLHVDYGIEHPQLLWDSVRSLTVTGVDIFVLISGYFTIKCNVQKIVNFYLMTVFYGILCTSIVYFVSPANFSLREVVLSFFPMSNGQTFYWFVSKYFMLMLFSPMINFFLFRASLKQYLYLLFLMAYITFFSGWVLNDTTNLTGYNLFNFIFLYVLGFGLRKYKINTKVNKRILALMYCAFSILIFLTVIYFPGRCFRYSSPFIVGASMSLLLLLSKIELKSHAINVLATFMFPVYLIQDGAFGNVAYAELGSRFAASVKDGIYPWWMIAVYLVGLFAIAIGVESIRRMIFGRFNTWVGEELSNMAQRLSTQRKKA